MSFIIYLRRDRFLSGSSVSASSLTAVINENDRPILQIMCRRIHDLFEREGKLLLLFRSIRNQDGSPAGNSPLCICYHNRHDPGHYRTPWTEDSEGMRTAFSRTGTSFSAWIAFSMSLSFGKINTAKSPLSKSNFAIGIIAGSPESR